MVFEALDRAYALLDTLWETNILAKELSSPHQLHRFDRSIESQDRDHTPEIVGKHMQAHFSSDIGQPFGEEVGVTHPAFQCPEYMFDRSAPDGHRFG